jgi:hypothetical protein
VTTITCVHTSQDAKYVDEKLRDLMSIAEDAIGSLEQQIKQIEANVTQYEIMHDDPETVCLAISTGFAPDSEVMVCNLLMHIWSHYSSL